MRILIILTFIFGINSCTAQSESEKKLIGKWILVAESNSFLEEIEPLTEDNSESKTNAEKELKTILTFNRDRTIFINQMGNKYNATYKLNDSTLILGNRKYIIIKLEKNKMIYKEKDDLFNNHYEYKKVD
jgi:heat shock protein HslJ